MVCFIPSTPAHLAPSSISSQVPKCNFSTSRTSFVQPLVRRNRPSIRASHKTCSPSMSIYNIPPSTLHLLSEISDANRNSLYVTAFVFLLTFWGGISFVKGSTKARVTQASFTIREPSSAIAKKASSYLMNRAYVADANKDGRKGVITFTGNVRASTSVAALLVSVGASGIWAATYILNFVLPEALQSPYWGLLSLLAFGVVPWYWKEATRTEEVKLMVEENGETCTLFVKGHRDEIEELEKAFSWKRNEPVYEDDEKKNKVQKQTS